MSQVLRLRSLTLPASTAALSLPTCPHTTRRGSKEASDCSGAPLRAPAPPALGNLAAGVCVLAHRLALPYSSGSSLGETGPETGKVRRSAGREPRQAGQVITDRMDERGSRLALRLAGGGAG